MHTELFKLEHLEAIQPLSNKLELAKELVMRSELSGKLVGFSLLNKGDVIAIGGIVELWPYVGDAFSIMSDMAVKYPKSLWSAFSKNIELCCNVGKYRRVQATVKTDFDAGVRFIERLGFKKEGLMEQFGPDGLDYYMYARLQ